MKRPWHFIILSLILFIIFLLPWIYLMNFAVLQMDDFCRTEFHLDYFSNLKKWYLTHNGRYINAILALLPVYNIEIYRSSLILLFLLLAFSFNFLIKNLFAAFCQSQEWSKVLFLSTTVMIGVFALLPEINEFFYWYAAATVYQFSAILFLFFLGLIVKFWLKKELHFFMLLVVITLLNGNSELLVGIINFLLITVLIFDLQRSRKINYRLIILNLVSWISTLLMIYAPGMITRRSDQQLGGDLFGAAKVAVIYGTKFIAVSMFDLSLILLYIFLFLFLWSLVRKERKKTTHIPPLALMVISYLSVISMVFILFYATGSFNSDGEWRASNLLRFATFSFFIVNIFNFCYYFKNKGIKWKVPKPVLSLITIAMFLSFFWNENFQVMANGFSSGDVQDFSQQVEEREIFIKNNNHTLELKYIERKGFLKTGDRALKKVKWVKECYLEYVNSRYKKNYTVITFIDN